MKKTLQPPCGRRKTGQPRSARGNAFPPLVAGATTLPGGKHVTGFAGRLQLPYESSSFATPTSWGHYKAPLCCELLMKGLLFRALLSHRSAGGEGGAVRHQRGEKPPEVADYRSDYHDV